MVKRFVDFNLIILVPKLNLGFIGSTLGILIQESGVTVRAMAWVFKLAPMLAVILVNLSMASNTVLAVTILGMFLCF